MAVNYTKIRQLADSQRKTWRHSWKIVKQRNCLDLLQVWKMHLGIFSAKS